MMKASTRLFLILVLTFTTVLGCGTIPGAAMSSRTFNVSSFSLPVAMIYSSPFVVAAQAIGISISANAAMAFVMRFVMQVVFHVLEQQGRSSGLLNTILAAILNQLNVTVNYTPVECKEVVLNRLDPTVKFNCKSSIYHALPAN
ncbi:hypothetical protein KIN20_019240 [Parelaphostrongylus tenuis]|uniref:Uncharacterized protein n=1 Tax=Parelaphostrongylus tenuis TaxID=148309 RepID=A0AAD5N2X1_PARTN|nr:hypothetical protein KIN20_019240 [Parelaphostrongylus tenuis]